MFKMMSAQFVNNLLSDDANNSGGGGRNCEGDGNDNNTIKG